MRELSPAGPQHQDRRADKDMRGDGFQMRLEDADSYLAELSPRCAAKTVKYYCYALQLFYDELQEGKWSRYSSAHINAAASACNAFLWYAGHEECQLVRYIVKQEPSKRLAEYADGVAAPGRCESCMRPPVPS